MLVRMTRTPGRRVRRWAALQDAKARFSEVGQPTGEALVKLLHDSPLRDIMIERKGTRSRVRSVEL